MKINTKILKEALERLKKISSKRTTLPILNCVRIAATNNIMELWASNLDEYQREVIPCDGGIESVCVNTEKLLWSIGGDVSEINLSGERLSVLFGKNSSTIATLPGEEFPKWPEGKAKASGVNCADLANGIRRVKPFTSDDATNYIMAGVHIVGSASKLKCEATNRISFSFIEIAAISADFEAIIPTSSCDNIAEAMSRDAACVYFSERGVFVDYDGGEYYAKAVDGKFPDTSVLSNKKLSPVGVISTAEFCDHIKHCCFFCSNDSSLADRLNVEFASDGLTLSFNGKESDSSRTVSGEFSPVTWVLGAKNLSRSASAIVGESVKVFATEQEGSGAFVIQDGDATIIVAQMNPIEKKDAAGQK